MLRCPFPLAFAILAASCAAPGSDAPAGPGARGQAVSSAAPTVAVANPGGVPALASPHVALDGRGFPDKVVALTWDDGPDANTLALASYLEKRHISATFFVVGAWAPGVSDDPGDGQGVFTSGYDFLPVLGDLVGLGHRLGNHTLNHVILRESAGAATVDRELRENQRNIDPFMTNEMRLFRAPGGGWGSFAQDIVDHDAYLSRLVGPVRWDVDQKDWDESLHCRGPRGASECERAAPGGALRMKASVVAARYVASIESAGHGIVLLHDRVGHVGSTYGLEIAQAMIPQLEARGFVFAAPVLHFSELTLRHHEDAISGGGALHWDAGTVRVGDVNGDGRHDVCGRGAMGVTCAISVQGSRGEEDRLPRTVFHVAAAATAERAPAGVIHLADITGDGQADVCIASHAGVACATSNVVGELGAFRTWSKDDHASSLRFADVDGDGKADACTRTAAGVACARNLGTKFDLARPWLADMTDARGWSEPRFADAVQLADVDGDGRADLCGRGPNGLVCARSTGKSFGKLEKWALSSELAQGELRFGDLNGDRREDVCAVGPGGAWCALSTGRGFTKATLWLGPSLPTGATGALEDAQLGDVNGDGRADLCGRTAEGLACALAP